MCSCAAFAQGAISSAISACNLQDGAQSAARIQGCTTLIKSHEMTGHGLAVAFTNRGNAYMAGEQYELAIEDYTEAIRLDPSFAKAFNNRGTAYRTTGKLDLAMEDLNAAIRLGDQSIDPYVSRALIYELRADYVPAIADIDHAIGIEPASGVLWNERCWIDARRGALQDALSDCNETFKLGPATAAKFDSRGFLNLKLGRWELAADDYQKSAGDCAETGECPLRPRPRSAQIGRCPESREGSRSSHRHSARHRQRVCRRRVPLTPLLSTADRAGLSSSNRSRLLQW